MSFLSDTCLAEVSSTPFASLGISTKKTDKACLNSQVSSKMETNIHGSHHFPDPDQLCQINLPLYRDFIEKKTSLTYKVENEFNMRSGKHLNTLSGWKTNSSEVANRKGNGVLKEYIQHEVGNRIINIFDKYREANYANA